MNISLKWLNAYLTPAPGTAPLTAEQAEAILMAQGLPAETRTQMQTCEGPDVAIDLEITSNRGDCLCHFGAAREVAASPAGVYGLTPPHFDPAPADSEPADRVLGLDNTVPDGCPLFIARVVRGVKVGPSPAWMRARLEGVGQRPINNIVDVTNFIALELGNPCHVFDLKKLAGPKIVVRYARDGEKLTTLDGKQRVLKADELVVADAERAQGLAGVMGGGDSEVTEGTTDVVLEVATWDPVSVRRAARRHQLRTTASYRYERIVDARTLEFAADRAVALLCELGGGRACTGELRAGAAMPATTTVRFRPARCSMLLGYTLPVETMVRHLRAVGVEVGPLGRGGEELLCEIPPHRPDLTREVDLIEEVGRIQGLDSVPIHEKVAVRVTPPQKERLARREISSVLTGLGFFETVTFSFTSPKDAKAFVPAGLDVIQLDDERRGEEPSLRPSVLTGLMATRRQNQHGNVSRAGGVRLFEIAAAYAEKKIDAGTAESVEHLNLGLLLDVPGKGRADDVQEAVRTMRGTVESIVKVTHGAGAALVFEPAPPHCAALDAGACASILIAGERIGYLGLVSRSVQASYDLSAQVVACEVSLTALTRAYPPKSQVVLPPAFPGIERDLSLVVDESVRWASIEGLMKKNHAAPMDGVEFVGTFRDEKKLGKGKKSVTLRLSFRDASRTLRHEEVDAPVQKLLEHLRRDLAFEIRS